MTYISAFIIQRIKKSKGTEWEENAQQANEDLELRNLDENTVRWF